MDENVPISIKKLIKELGYEAKTLKDENQLGIKNGDVAELAIKREAIIITLDSDFLTLKKELQKESRVISIKIHPRDPKEIGELVKKNLKEAINHLKDPGKVIISKEGLDFNYI